MQGARGELRARKPGEALSLSGRFKRKSRPRAEFSCTIPVILDGSFNVSPSEHLSPKPRKPRTKTQICEATMGQCLNWSHAV